MLPPIRPRPIIPIVMLISEWATSRWALRTKDARERFETRGNVLSKMQAQRATAARHEDLEIAARLRGLHHTKRIALPRHRQIDGIITRDLQKHAAVRPALVGLPRRVQEPWTEA